jgi:hypothetical protein
MPADVQIISTRQDAGFDSANRPIETMRTEFKIGEDGPFVVRIPKDEWTGDRVKQEIERVKRELESIRSV